MQVREWATNHAREVEALAKRPHGALAFVRAVSEGSVQVLGVAAQLMAMHSLELAAAEASVSASGKGSTDHWKPWMRDGLDVLESTLGEPWSGWLEGCPLLALLSITGWRLSTSQKWILMGYSVRTAFSGFDRYHRTIGGFAPFPVAIPLALDDSFRCR